MTTATEPFELKLVRRADGVEVDLLPLQGTWSAAQYLALTDQTNQLIEFTDGELEVLPMPTHKHQMILRFLLFAFVRFAEPPGVVLFSSLRVRIRPDKFREPDILLMLDAADPRIQNAYWLGADLVVEVVSPDNPERDTVEKRVDYAEGGIAEYWIVDPQAEQVTVLRLEHDRYVEHGVFERGTQATSVLLAGFAVDVDAVFDAA